MKQGDFSQLAKDYIHRAGYSLPVLKALKLFTGAHQTGSQIADVGAGTGKLTENLIEIGLSGVAVEPNAAMFEEGKRLFESFQQFRWQSGSAEKTGLPEKTFQWVLMGSSFHWTQPELSLPEFHRILKPGGYFTALWNPRDLEKNPLHSRIETKIKEIIPELKRVSSGGKPYTQDLEQTLLSSGYFSELIFMEAPHEVSMTPERYLGAWRSVNDIQAQAGPDRFQKILAMIETEISGLSEIIVSYRTRSWTVRAKERST